MLAIKNVTVAVIVGNHPETVRKTFIYKTFSQSMGGVFFTI